MKYFVRVELYDYNGKLVAGSDCTCQENITDDTIRAAARIATELMLKHHTGIKIERKNQS